MPTLAQVRNAVDSRLVTLWTNQVIPRQDTYASNHNGRYWQGIITTNLVDLLNNPNNADLTILEVVPDTSRHPTDQAASWAAAGIDLGVTIPCALAITIYDGPFGVGYVGIIFAMWAGTVYSRSQNNGPETWRTEPWHIVTLPEA